MKVTKAATLVFVSVLLTLPAGAQQSYEAPGFATPESYVERVRQSGAVLELSLNDAIRLALTNNLEIEIENYNEDLNRERIIGTKGFYDPTLEFSLGWNSIETPNTSILDAGADRTTRIRKSWFLDTTFRQNVQGGGNLILNFNNDRNTTNSSFSLMNPQFGSVLTARFTQPLWKGFRETNTKRQLKIYNLDIEISDSQFKQRVAQIIQQVQNQYWEMVFAVENYEARRRSLELAIVQFHNNEKRVEIGVMAPIEITSSRAEVATREQDMIQSEVQIINAQNGLKRLLAPDPRASIWDLSLLPTDKPQVMDVQITLDQAIETSLQRRPEMEQIMLQLEQNEVNRKYFKKDGKPAVDLSFGLTSTGTAGQILQSVFIDTDGDGVPDTRIDGVPAADSPFFGNFGGTLGQAFGFNYINYNVAVNVAIPLRNRSNDAQLAQVSINERQLLSRLKNTQQLVIVDVRNAFESIATRKQGLQAAQVARRLSQEQLDGENKRFEAGLSTNFEVLRYQRDLTSAQVQELRAMVDYQLALTALQESMFTIIDDNDLVTAKRED